MSVKVRKQTDHFSQPTKPFKRSRCSYVVETKPEPPCFDKREIQLIEEQIRKLSFFNRERKEVKEVKQNQKLYTEEEVLKRIKDALVEQQTRLEDQMTSLLFKTLKEQEESFENYCSDQLNKGLKKSVHDYFS